MKLLKLVFMLFLAAQISACTKLSNAGDSSTFAAGTASNLDEDINALPIVGTETNILSVTVGACGATLNILCASVTICVPGSTTQCQTIPNLLVDTGSYGLRVFSSLITIPLVTETVSGKNVAECVSYLDGSSDWGSVKTADVYFNGEVAASLPIQTIDPNFATLPSSCHNPDQSPDQDGFNGVLGVGQLIQDCGAPCTTIAHNNLYFTCTGGGTCTNSVMALADQVSNPVASFGLDSNGVALELPAVPVDGAVRAPGYLVFGIGTQSDNTPGVDVKTYAADASGNIQTTFSGTTMSAFLDSGSNALFFPAPSSGVLPLCSDPLSSFYCPGSVASLSAVIINAASTVSNTFNFQILSAATAFDANNPNYSFSNLGGDLTGEFDWGLPFFLGRTVFVGIEGMSTPGGTGPNWSF